MMLSPLISLAGTGRQLWTSIAPLPSGNAGSAHGAIANRLIVAGGTEWMHEVKTTLNTVLEYDPDQNCWREMAPLPRPFAYGIFAVCDRSLYLAGGTDGSRNRADSMVVGSGGTGKDLRWKLPYPLAYSGSAIHGNHLYVLGGTPDLHDLTQLIDSFFTVDLIRGKVNSLPPFPGGRVMHAALADMGGVILVFPGATFDASTRKARNTRAAWRYDCASRRWNPIAPYPFPVRGLAACALDENHVLLVGGDRDVRGQVHSAKTNACFLYDLTNNCYTALPPLPYAAMLIGLQKIGDRVYLYGGEDRDRHRVNAAYRARISDLLMSQQLATP